MRNNKMYISRGYWSNYIDSIIESIKEDKDTIIDMLMYGELSKAEIIMNLSAEQIPSYRVRFDKIAKKSPFEEGKNE